MKIAGRKSEISQLQSLLEKDESSFVAVYGRRRIGKTYLIRQVYENEIVFECSGVLGGNRKLQLENFWRSLLDSFPTMQAPLPPQSWIEAFFQLRGLLKSQSQDTKKVIFLDEIPWFDTSRSGFLAALDGFWNQFCTKRTDIILVICGSAASWIIEKVVNNRGGLHNRLTNRILLQPFTLGETAEYFDMKRVNLSKKDITKIYMCLGGVPYYFMEISQGQSVPQILDHLFFGKKAVLKGEFENLYASLFKHSVWHKKVVTALASKNKGLTRTEILKELSIQSSGEITTVLEELMQCGFIGQIYPINKAKTDSLFRLIDEYSLFYFKFLKDEKTSSSWSQVVESPQYKSWSGYAFENICMKHTYQIKKH